MAVPVGPWGGFAERFGAFDIVAFADSGLCGSGLWHSRGGLRSEVLKRYLAWGLNDAENLSLQRVATALTTLGNIIFGGTYDLPPERKGRRRLWKYLNLQVICIIE